MRRPQGIASGIEGRIALKSGAIYHILKQDHGQKRVHVAFAGCRSLESIEFPPSLTKIDRLAFSDCTSLETVTIPAGVRTIGAGAFVRCTGMTSYHVDAANPNYRLTTYRQPLSAMAEGLVAVLNGRANTVELSRFSGRLVIRDSA